MAWLILVSLIWAFSFGLIKGRLTGVDPSLVGLLRIVLALVVFLPFLRPRGLRKRDTLALLGIGAVQFGVMYVTYLSAFRYLQAYEIAVLTIFTPIFVCLFEDLLAHRWRAWPWIAAIVATIGAGIVRPFTPGVIEGIVLMQVSNACFAFGQVAYRRWRVQRPDLKDGNVFAVTYVGALLATLPTAAPSLPTINAITSDQWLTLAYLGVIASGLCFFLWNYGAVRTSPGVLAVANNLKIPLGVAASLWVFHESAEPWRVLTGGSLVVAAGALATWAARRRA
jgi:drug/metabolite transporter (DMT)-like permease